jgi:hypothetical protein
MPFSQRKSTSGGAFLRVPGWPGAVSDPGICKSSLHGNREISSRSFSSTPPRIGARLGNYNRLILFEFLRTDTCWQALFGIWLLLVSIHWSNQMSKSFPLLRTLVLPALFLASTVALAQTFTFWSDDGERFKAVFNPHGVVLTSNSITLYVGVGCDAWSPEYGGRYNRGFWRQRGDNLVVRVPGRRITFSGQRLYGEDSERADNCLVSARENR